MKRYLNLLCAVLYSLTGVMWICNGLRDDSIFEIFLAVVWLAGGVIWLVRFFKEKTIPERRRIMVKHIVLFTVKEGEDKDQVAKITASVLEPLAGKIQGLNHVEVRRTYAGADIALYCELESREAMDAYAVHPLHEEAKSHFFPLLSGRVAADYEV